MGMGESIYILNFKKSVALNCYYEHKQTYIVRGGGRGYNTKYDIIVMSYMGKYQFITLA